MQDVQHDIVIPEFDIVIVGAGAAGLSAAKRAAENGLSYIVLERSAHLLQTIQRFAKGKHVMAEPSSVPGRSSLPFNPGPRERVLADMTEAVSAAQLRIAFNEEVIAIQKADSVFTVRTSRRTYTARYVIIAIGTQGTLRKLHVPGEELPHVRTDLEDPAAYRAQDIIVVGGGSSAVEIALALANTNRVSLIVRGTELVKAKASLVRAVDTLIKEGSLIVHFGTKVQRIDSEAVTLGLPSGKTAEVPARSVFVKIGADLPRAFLERCGVTFTSLGTPELNKRYETVVPGLFLVGAVSGRGDLIKLAMNAGYEVVEHICGRTVEPADEPQLREKLDFLPSGTVSARISQLQSIAPFLAGGLEEDLRELLQASTFCHVRRGQDIGQKGEHTDKFYIVLAGRVEILEPQTETTRLRVQRAPGSFFNETNFFAGRPLPLDAKAATAVQIWEVPRLPMLKFLRLTPPVQKIVERTALLRMFEATLSLDHTGLLKLLSIARTHQVEKGGVIFKVDNPALYVIRSGKIHITVERKGLAPVSVYRETGAFVTETLFTTPDVTVSAIAIDNAEIVEITKQDLLSHDPEVTKNLFQKLGTLYARTIGDVLLSQVYPEQSAAIAVGITKDCKVGQNQIAIDENLCIHCDNCTIACAKVHADGLPRLKRAGEKVANILLGANSCRHCENAPCLTDCPPGNAIQRDLYGTVHVVTERCIGCGQCATLCPFNAIEMARVKPTWSFWRWAKSGFATAPTKELPIKCDLCRDLSGGPVCESNCPTHALRRVTQEQYTEYIEPLIAQRISANKGENS